MIGLVLALTLAASPFKCAMEDALCWRTAALEQLERAEQAEGRLQLETMARQVAERMTAEEIKRGDRWKAAALAVAPKPPAFYETPVFWGLTGVAIGAAATVAIAYAVAPASR